MHGSMRLLPHSIASSQGCLSAINRMISIDLSSLKRKILKIVACMGSETLRAGLGTVVPQNISASKPLV